LSILSYGIETLTLLFNLDMQGIIRFGQMRLNVDSRTMKHNYLGVNKCTKCNQRYSWFCAI